jgi:predicted MPP superfamily phosphohydrolase
MMTFALFALMFLSVLIGAHLAVFLSLSFFLASFGAWPRVSVLILSVVFPANFILASFLMHSAENASVRLWYTVSAFSLGLISNLFFLIILGWGVIFAVRLFGAQPRMAIIGMAIIIFGSAVSIYGISNAFRPIIRHATVAIQGLPEQWKGKTIVQLSDIHLGPVYRADFLRGVVDQVNGLHPAAVMIVGDLFDGMDGDLDSLVGPLGDIRAEKGVFFSTGNHETYLGVNRSLSALEETGVEILDGRFVVVDGLAIIGISYPDRGAEKDIPALAGAFSRSVPNTPNILLYHAPIDIDRMKESGIDLQLSGHTHRGQQFPFNFVTHLVHKGYDYGLYHFGKYTLSVSSGVGTWGPPIRLGTRSEIVAITLE